MENITCAHTHPPPVSGPFVYVFTRRISLACSGLTHDYWNISCPFKNPLLWWLLLICIPCTAGSPGWNFLCDAVTLYSNPSSKATFSGTLITLFPYKNQALPSLAIKWNYICHLLPHPLLPRNRLQDFVVRPSCFCVSYSPKRCVPWW